MNHKWLGIETLMITVSVSVHIALMGILVKHSIIIIIIIVISIFSIIII